MKIDEINSCFIERASENEKVTMMKCNLREGWFQKLANHGNALQKAAEWIGSDIKKEARKGYIKLLECQKATGFDALSYSLEALYVEFAETYGGKYPDLFFDEVVRVAKARIGK